MIYLRKIKYLAENIEKQTEFRYNRDINEEGNTCMKEFFRKYSYTMVKLLVNQVAIALFGVGMAFASGYGGGTKLKIAMGIGSIVFYLFLLYAHMWEVGAKDGISAEARSASRGLWRGFVIGLCANAINLLLALLILPGAFAPMGSTLKGVSSVFSVIALLLEGMYIAILSLPLGGIPLNQYAWAYFAITVPAILVCGVAYIIGSYNLHATNILIPKNKDVKNNGRPE